MGAFVLVTEGLCIRFSGYETDERSSLGNEVKNTPVGCFLRMSCPTKRGARRGSRRPRRATTRRQPGKMKTPEGYTPVGCFLRMSCPKRGARKGSRRPRRATTRRQPARSDNPKVATAGSGGEEVNACRWHAEPSRSEIDRCEVVWFKSRLRNQNRAIKKI